MSEMLNKDISRCPGILQIALTVALLTCQQALAAPILELGKMPAAPQELQAKGNDELSRGIQAFRAGRTAEALALAKIAVGRSQNEYQGHLLLMYCWVALDQLADLNRHLGELRIKNPQFESRLRQTATAALMRDKRWYRASQMLQEASDLKSNVQMRFLQMSILSEQGNTSAALAILRPMASTMPEDTTVQFNLARLALLDRDFTTAESAAKATLARLPNDTRVFSLLATSQLMQQKYGDVRASTAQWIKVDPKNPYAHAMAGIAELASAQGRRAQEHFATSSALRPNFLESRLGITAAQLQQGNGAAVAQSVAAGGAAAPKDGLVYLFAAAGLQLQGNTAAAATELRRAGDLFADLRTTKLDVKGLPEAQSAAAATALAEANYLLRFAAPESATARLSRPGLKGPLIEITRARALRQAGKLQPAATAYEQIVKSYPSLCVPAAEHADILFAMGRIDDAIRSYQEIGRRECQFLNPAARLGDLHNSAKRLDAAIDSYRAQLRVTPDDRHVRNQLAATLQLRGRSADLVESLKLADDLLASKAAPDRDNVLDTRATTLAAMGRRKEALEIFDALVRSNAALGAESWHTFGNLLVATDRPKALRLIEKALDTGLPYAGRDADIALLNSRSGKVVQYNPAVPIPRGSEALVTLPVAASNITT